MRIDYSDSYHLNDVVDRTNECLAQLNKQIESLESALIILTQSLDLTCRTVATLEAKVSTLEANHKDLIERIAFLANLRH